MEVQNIVPGTACVRVSEIVCGTLLSKRVWSRWLDASNGQVFFFFCTFVNQTKVGVNKR